MRPRAIDLGRFLLVWHVAAAIVLVVGVSTSFYLIDRSLFVAAWETRAVALARHMQAESERSGLDLPPSESSRADTDRLLRAELADFGASAIRIFDRRGRLTHASGSAIAGRRPRSPGVSAALEGRATTQILRGETGRDVLVTWVPLRSGRRMVGVFEIDQRVDDLYALLDMLRTIVIGGSALIALALVAAVFLIGRKADALLGEERVIRRRYEDRLRGIADELEQEIARRTAELREERDRLQAITDHVPSAFLLLDGERRIQLATRSFEDLLGAPPPLGQPCDAGGTRRFGCPDCLATRAMATGKVERAEWSTETAGGGKRWIEQIALPIEPGPAGAAVIEVFSDVTQRKAIEEGMIRSAKLATLGEMAAVVAHEVRNSLNSTKLLLQLMADNPEEPPGKEPVAVALGSMGRAERLITNLLRFARPMPMRLAEADAVMAAQEAIALVGHQFDRTRVALELDADGPLVATFDPDQVRESLVNLLLNAVLATPAGGHVLLSVKRERAARDLGENGSVAIARGAPALLYSVRDDGCGMTPEQASRAFDPFFTTRQEGTGLGLPTVRRIVSDHGGIVTLETAPQRGTSVSMWLPLRGCDDG
ncbi:MAG: hypothetical protein HYY06_07450 [Deltaproteobacteria bacterium]|nr:hypothetical protein [Deltaproteobacteria bacterium]